MVRIVVPSYAWIDVGRKYPDLVQLVEQRDQAGQCVVDVQDNRIMGGITEICDRRAAEMGEAKKPYVGPF